MDTILAAIPLAGSLLLAVFIWVIIFNAVTSFIAKYFRFTDFFIYLYKKIHNLIGKPENHSS